MAHAKLAQSTVKAAVTKAQPNLVKEICYGIGLGIFAGSFWKMYHVNHRRRVEDFYAALEKGKSKSKPHSQILTDEDSNFLLH